jgi:hypothetical protein
MYPRLFTPSEFFLPSIFLSPLLPSAFRLLSPVFCLLSPPTK